MKKLTLSFICLLATLTVFANNSNLFSNDGKYKKAQLVNEGKYKKAMRANLDKLKSAKTMADMQQVANQFERIAGAEKSKWLPNYYAAYSYIRMTNFEKDGVKKDQLLDKAEVFLKKANKLQPNNSEIVALEAYLAMSRLVVNPMARGQQYSGIVFAKAGKAKALNPKNPRPYFLEGALKLNMPPAFGGGKDAACGLFKKAAANYDTFKPANELMPNWGKGSNAKMMKKCN